MKKVFLNSILLLCALIVGSSNVWATDVVYKTQQFTTGESSSYSANSNSYTGSFDNTYNGFTCNYSNFNNNNKSWAFVKCGGKGGAYTGVITTDAAIDKAITKVTLTIDDIISSNVTSITLYSSDSKSSGWASIGTFTKSVGAKEVTISSPAANKYYKIEAVCTKHSSKNGLLVISKIQFYIEDVAITSISLPSTETVVVGSTVTLTPTVAPTNYTETIDWESDDEGVATVSSAGVVTGVAAGTAYITAKSHGNPSTINDVCEVTVTAPIAVTGVTLKSSTTIEVGKTETLVPTILPANATNKTVAWFSDDEAKVSVDDDGVITGLAVTGGSPVTITVLTEDGDFEAECAVTVIPKNTDVNLTSPISITEWPSLSYGAADEYEVEGVCFTATQCMNNAGLQFKKSEGILASPLIKSSNGYTVIVTTNGTGTGSLTLQIGSETPVSITSGNSTTYSATTSNTSVAFTLTNSSGKACNIASIIITPNPLPITISSHGWASLYLPFNATIPTSDVVVYWAKAKDAGAGTITLKQFTGSVIDAGTGVIVKDKHADGSESHTYNFTYATGDQTDVTTGNLLTGGATAVSANSVYVLSAASTYDAPCVFGLYEGTSIPAYKSYILASSMSSAPTIRFEFEEENNATNIENIAANEKAVKFIENGRILILRDGITYDALGRAIR